MMMNWLKKFMIGRSGGDQLSIYLLALSLVLTVIGQLAGTSIVVTIGYIPLFVAISRVLSKDVQKRRMENYKFAIFISPIYAKLKKVESRIKGAKTHKHFKCANCKTMLRVPKGKGEILVTCPKCKTKCTRKT
ncbi:Zn-finger containing protein [Alkaliphilus metalliredigens QYMF]|uniref:Zn-finger containing protein n=1 Tax=Alkaliphilus metalliredigens (strain QYMF) TaxID=293826 RepID=A6TKG1_ALKMQ|nr:hypothetical protein [Alkaliphilus metalliredigens]ABR46679.1 Zn-finger containing protein [Alkaliphilus metalliredigens QYMF]